MTTNEVINNYPQALDDYFLTSNPTCLKYLEQDLKGLENSCKLAKLNGYDIESARNSEKLNYLSNYEGLIENIWQNTDAKVEIGTDATTILYSDTYAGKVVEISYKKDGSPKRVGVRDYKYEIEDIYDGECKVLDEIEGDIQYFTLRKGGGWYAEGQPKKIGSVRLFIGIKRTYRDLEF